MLIWFSKKIKNMKLNLKQKTKKRFQTFDEGVSSTTTIRGNWNEANDFVLTGKHVTEKEIDQVNTVYVNIPRCKILRKLLHYILLRYN